MHARLLQNQLRDIFRINNHAFIEREISRWNFSERNLIGAHYNEWARAISNQEAQSFGEAVVELFQGVKCKTCSRWIEDVSGKGKKWSCRCGVTTLE